jgi:hypothetical protein
MQMIGQHHGGIHPKGTSLTDMAERATQHRDGIRRSEDRPPLFRDRCKKVRSAGNECTPVFPAPASTDRSFAAAGECRAARSAA